MAGDDRGAQDNDRKETRVMSKQVRQVCLLPKDRNSGWFNNRKNRVGQKRARLNTKPNKNEP